VFKLIKAQATFNYMVIVVVITFALITIHKYFQRGIQAKVADFSDALIAPENEHRAYTTDPADFESSAHTDQDISEVREISPNGASSRFGEYYTTSSIHQEVTDPDYVGGLSETSSGGGMIEGSGGVE